ncbi:MAG: beta-ketoacyl-ACP synthase II [bacterium JZ-2024 1]
MKLNFASERRVVVTGMGAVTPYGKGVGPFWEAMKRGISCVKKIESFPTDNLACQIAAQITSFSTDPYIPPRQAVQMDRFCQFGVWAAMEALNDAGLDLSRIDPYRVGIITGSGIGGLDTFSTESRTAHERGAHRLTPFFIPKTIINLLSGWLSILTGIKGYSNTVVTACSTSSTAIGEGMLFIKMGFADVMVCGGSEAAVTPMGIGGFANMKALSTKFNDQPEKASRPFDNLRDGFVMGEGGAMLVLEDLAFAEKRGARIYAEVIGYSLTSDAYHITAPDPCGAGAASAMRTCLQMANISPDEVDYINAHGTSTPYNDKTETLAIKEVFGSYAYKIPISSTKSMHAHLLGAAGALESIVCIKTIQEGIIPPTINYEYPDPDCDLDYVPNVPRQKKVRVAMNNSFAFGGHNAILLFRAYPDSG